MTGRSAPRGGGLLRRLRADATREHHPPHVRSPDLLANVCGAPRTADDLDWVAGYLRSANGVLGRECACLTCCAIVRAAVQRRGVAS